MDDEVGCLLSILVLAIAGIASAAWIADNSADRYWKKQAVRAGHAEYYLDENNDRQWRWKEPHENE